MTTHFTKNKAQLLNPTIEYGRIMRLKATKHDIIGKQNKIK